MKWKTERMPMSMCLSTDKSWGIFDTDDNRIYAHLEEREAKGLTELHNQAEDGVKLPSLENWTMT